MRADGRIPAQDGGKPHSLEEVASSLVDLDGIETRVDQNLWDAAYLDPLRDILSRPGKGFRALLMERCWVIAGGDREDLPDCLADAIEMLHAGSLVIDDIEDDSRARRGRSTLHRSYGLPLALNTGNLLYFLALELIGRTPVPARLRADLFQEVSLALLRCHQGQALDLSVRITGVSRSQAFTVVDAATRFKTGSLMGLAAALSARTVGGGPEIVDAVRRFGTEIGVGLQMLDDWSGIQMPSRREKGIEDIRLARPTWPWAWLAESSDDLTYAETLRQARTLSIDWQADRVRDRMYSLLASTASDRIRAQLDGAVEGLRASAGECPELTSLKEDIELLTRAFEEE